VQALLARLAAAVYRSSRLIVPCFDGPVERPIAADAPASRRSPLRRDRSAVAVWRKGDKRGASDYVSTFSQRGRTADLVALLASDYVSTFRREKSDHDVVAPAASHYVSTFHADQVSGPDDLSILALAGLTTRVKRRPTRRPVQVSVRTRRAARASLASWSAN